MKPDEYYNYIMQHREELRSTINDYIAPSMARKLRKKYKVKSENSWEVYVGEGWYSRPNDEFFIYMEKLGVIKLDPNTDFDKNGINKYTLCKYDPHGIDKDGFNKRGFNSIGIHKDTGMRFDRFGWKMNLKHIETGTRLNPRGFDANGFRFHIRKEYKITEAPRFKQLDERGFDINGIHIFTGKIYDEDGFDVHGIHYITETPYDEEGYDLRGRRHNASR